MSDEEKQEEKQDPQVEDASAEKKAEKKSEKAEKSENAGPKAEKASPDKEGKQSSGADGKAEKASGQPTAKDLLNEQLGDVKIRKAKGSKNITHGMVYILATFNNTKVTFTDMQGNALSWSSAGKCNFRGSRKSTAYAAQVVTQDAGRIAMSHGLKEVKVKVKGPGTGRDSAIRALQNLGLIVSSIEDITPVPHNGCRPPKRRRV